MAAIDVPCLYPLQLVGEQPLHLHQQSSVAAGVRGGCRYRKQNLTGPEVGQTVPYFPGPPLLESCRVHPQYLWPCWDRPGWHSPSNLQDDNPLFTRFSTVGSSNGLVPLGSKRFAEPMGWHRQDKTDDLSDQPMSVLNDRIKCRCISIGRQSGLVPEQYWCQWWILSATNRKIGCNEHSK